MGDIQVMQRKTKVQSDVINFHLNTFGYTQMCSQPLTDSYVYLMRSK